MKNNIKIILLKNFSRLKKIKFNENDDLINNGILDSLELIKLLTILKKVYKFDLKKYQKKYNNFKIKNLENFI
jgi:acyl carrier protein|tara:strand:+ start:814 stop:1032 length:219 start_codon:yes stop_codon:yes gene_type:complete